MEIKNAIKINTGTSNINWLMRILVENTTHNLFLKNINIMTVILNQLNFTNKMDGFN